MIQKRVGKGIWQGLYDFPFIEKEKLNGLELSELNQYEPVEIIQDGQLKHILSHQELYVSFWIVKVVKFDLNENQIIVPIAAIETFPLPQLLIRYINQSRLFGAD